MHIKKLPVLISAVILVSTIFPTVNAMSLSDGNNIEYGLNLSNSTNVANESTEANIVSVVDFSSDALEHGLEIDSYSATLEQDIFNYTNYEREKASKEKLIQATNLVEYARQRAKEISINYSHTRPNGLEALNVGENIAIAFPYMSYYSEFDKTKNENISHATVDNSKKLDKDYNLGKEIVGLWMASDEHKKNILKDSEDYGLMQGYKSLAVGTYIDKNGWIYAVQIFGIDDESK